jgi:hypothetical protein
MIRIKQKQLFIVPCKDKLTGKITDYSVYAFDYTGACDELEYELDLRWIIGYGSL